MMTLFTVNFCLIWKSTGACLFGKKMCEKPLKILKQGKNPDISPITFPCFVYEPEIYVKPQFKYVFLYAFIVLVT